MTHVSNTHFYQDDITQTPKYLKWSLFGQSKKAVKLNMSKITERRWKIGKTVSLKHFSDGNTKHLNYYLVSTLANKRSQTVIIFIQTISYKVTSNTHVNFK